MTDVVQNANFNQTFVLVSSFDHTTPLTGASPTVLISKNGGAFNPVNGIVYEIGDGWYNIGLTPTDTNTVGILSFHCTAVGADDTDFSDQVFAPPPFIPPINSAIGSANFPDFLAFVVGTMGVPNPPVDPDNPPNYVIWAFNYAINLVNPDAVNIPNRGTGWPIFALMVYNLGGDFLINIGMDAPGAPIVATGPSGQTYAYWAHQRFLYKVNEFVGGIVQSASDQGTSTSLVVPEGLQAFTILNLEQLKTPYGRRYLGLAQSWGSQIGLS